MKVLPLVPCHMPIQRRMRQTAYGLWGLAILVAVAVAIARRSLPFTFEVPFIILLLGAAAFALSFAVGRKEARRLVVPREGLVCPTCLYPLDTIEGEALCPECATYFNPSAVISVWRSSFGLRSLIANPDLTDLHALLASARRAKTAKDEPRTAAKDGDHVQPTD